MIDIVKKTLKHWRQTDFVWGKSDCLLSLADYLIDCGYDDHGKEFRFNYDDEKGANEFIRKYDGEENIIDVTGLPKTTYPKYGDLILAEFANHKVGGICTDGNIAFRTWRGVVEIKLSFVKILQIWKVEQCHQ